jgi:formylglycine-generating enzyme required for sulfatase activity
LVEEAHGTERIKVLDFGIAKLKETKTEAFLTKAGTIIGTPQYMSPEQCQGKPLDPSSDVYSIGVLLYEMLSGEIPFDGESTLQVVYNQLHELPRPLQELAPDVPAPVVEVVMRALEKRPENRQPSAIKLSEELKRAVEMLGDPSSWAISEAVALGQLRSADARTPTSIPTVRLEQLPPSSTVAGLPRSANRETTDLSRPSINDASPLRGGRGRVTSVVNSESTGKSTVVPETVVQNSVGKKPRVGLIATAAAILLAVISAIFYLSSRSPAPASTPQPSLPPEGMVLIPGGKFVMGRNGGGGDEGPAHEVEVKSFFLDVNEVTNQSYAKFVEATRRPAPKNWKYNGSYMPGEATVPVTYVTWEDATAYAKWADKRLPTEAEWEYAARGGAKSFLYPWGNDWLAGAANVDRKGQAKPAPVRSFEQDVSAFGVFDLAGNVSEWVQDHYTSKYGASPDQQLRVYRGGNFLDAPDKSTNTFRWSDYPTDIPDDQILRVGFRCAKDAARQ